MDDLFQEMASSIIEGDTDKALALAQESIVSKVHPLEAISKGFVIGINTVGEQFGRGEAFLPELVMAGEAMKAAVGILEPELARLGSQREILGRVVLATVEGDIHEIGKTLVGTMLNAAGFEVHDLGVDVQSDRIIQKAIDINADIIAISALLTTTMVRQQEIIDELEKEGLRSRFKILVGGAPITKDWVTKIKADGFSEDAIGAVKVARQLVGK